MDNQFQRIPIQKHDADKNRVKLEIENVFSSEVSSVTNSNYTHYEDIIINTEDGLQLKGNLIDAREEDNVMENVVVEQENPIYVTKTYQSDQHGHAIFDQTLTGDAASDRNTKIKGDSNERTESNIIMEHPMDLSFKRTPEISEEQRHTNINDNTQAKRCSNDQSTESTAVRPLTYYDSDYNREHKPNKSQRIKSLSSTKRFACNFCDYKSNNKCNLIVHIRIHTGEKPCICTVCDKKFRDKSNLVSHIRVHTGEKPFICTVCCKKFTQKSTLVSHIRVHTGEKPFICTVCAQKFTRKSSLVSHSSVHTEEKPFICTLCNKKFKRKRTLVRHIRIHTEKKPFTCTMCEYKCKRKISFKKHLSKHTSDI